MRKIQIDGIEYDSINDASRKTGVPPSTIRVRVGNPDYPTWITIDTMIHRTKKSPELKVKEDTSKISHSYRYWKISTEVNNPIAIYIKDIEEYLKC